jgi:4-hydroxythreonine-4-phosphate dehydrogenase
MNASLPTIGLMLGDVTGIGPEICAKLLSTGGARNDARVTVIGDARVLELGARDAGTQLAWRPYETVDWSRPEIPLIDIGNIDPAQFTRGAVSAESGRLTGETLKYMIDLALAGRLDGICFAPLNKGALHQGGWKFHDEHQMFAHLTGHSGFFGEMNVIKEFSTFRVTSHIAVTRPHASPLPRLTRMAAKAVSSATKKSASFARRWRKCAPAASPATARFPPIRFFSRRCAANTTA